VIARALLNSPELIIADEPTGNLDPQTGRELMELLHTISQSGTAVIMATHNMQFIEEYPAKCYICEDGKLKIEG
jgi:cell division transport system ATP-binding protein